MSIRSSFLSTSVCLVVFLGLLSACTDDSSTSKPPAAAEPKADFETVKNLIWEKEVAINAARPQTGPKDYLDASTDSYVAWSVSGGPVTIAELRANAAKYASAFPNQEKIELFFEAFALEDDTAIIYYSTQRTRLGDGTEVDQRYHVGHIWERDDADGEWKMLGSMVRQATQPAE